MGAGRNLLALGVATVMLVMETLSTADAQVEAVDVSCEEIISVEPIIEVEQGEVFTRTHEVIVNEFTYDEAQLLMKVAQAEAGNQGEDGMWLVMSVIFNRRAKEAWPNTIQDVVMQYGIKKGKKIYQFSTVAKNTINKVEISTEAHQALARIEMGEVAPQIIAFENSKSDLLGAYFTEVFTYRDHKFYVEKEP